MHRALKSVALLGICLLALGAPAAHAQNNATPLLDRFIAPDIYGPGVAPEVTVLSRLRPEYDPPGIRSGEFIIRPWLVESGGYESNVLGTSAAKGSALVESNAEVSAQSDFSRNSVHAAVSVDDLRYLDLARQSYTNWQAAIGGTLDIGRDTLSLDYSHLTLNQTALDLDTPIITTPLPFTIDVARVAYRALLSRLSVTPNVSVARFSFSNGYTAGGPYQQSYRDRNVVTPGVTLGYELAPRRQLVLVVNDAVAAYDTAAPGLARRDYNDLSVLVGLDDEISGALRLRLLGGYETRQFSSAQYSTIQAPVLEASASWTPTGLTTVTATVARRIEDANAEATAGTTELSGQLRIDHEYLRNLLLYAEGGVYQDQYSQGGGSQVLWRGGAGVTHLVSRSVRIGLDYAVYDRQGRAGGTVQGVGPNYIDHRILLQLHLAL